MTKKKLNTIRQLKDCSCRNCRFLHFKGKWIGDSSETKEFYCGKNVTSAHNGIEGLPDEKYCDDWESLVQDFIHIQGSKRKVERICNESEDGHRR